MQSDQSIASNELFNRLNCWFVPEHLHLSVVIRIEVISHTQYKNNWFIDEQQWNSAGIRSCKKKRNSITSKSDLSGKSISADGRPERRLPNQISWFNIFIAKVHGLKHTIYAGGCENGIEIKTSRFFFFWLIFRTTI